MNLPELFGTGTLYIPWAITVDGKNVPASSGRATPVYCADVCTDRECQNGSGTLLGRQCRIGFTYFQGKVGNSVIVLFGTIGPGGRETIESSVRRRYKDDMKGRAATARDFSAWLDRVKNLNTLLTKERDQVLSEALHPLHETPKIAEEIRNATESIINNKPGKTFDERFASAQPLERTVYKGAQLLVDSFDMLSIFFNPDSAKLGEKISTEPYKLLHKLSMVLSTNKQGGQRKRVEIQGTSFRKFLVFESFRIIPLTLLNNAIKYAMTNEVTINLEDKTDGTKITITSIGPIIENQELTRIFERGYRGTYAESLDKEGMGIGLYVARLAAAANRMSIQVESEPLSYQIHNIPMARNSFSFIVRDVIG